MKEFTDGQMKYSKTNELNDNQLFEFKYF